jgi:hypothetical protein
MATFGCCAVQLRNTKRTSPWKAPGQLLSQKVRMPRVWSRTPSGGGRCGEPSETSRSKPSVPKSCRYTRASQPPAECDRIAAGGLPFAVRSRSASTAARTYAPVTRLWSLWPRQRLHSRTIDNITSRNMHIMSTGNSALPGMKQGRTHTSRACPMVRHVQRMQGTPGQKLKPRVHM